MEKNFHQRHCTPEGDCPLRTTCEVKMFPDGHERRGCRIEWFAEGTGYKRHLATDKNMAIASGIALEVKGLRMGIDHVM